MHAFCLQSTVLELAKWLLANNPNKAKVMAPGAPELAALAAAPDDDIDAQIEAAERISAARKARFAAELGRKSSEVRCCQQQDVCMHCA